MPLQLAYLVVTVGKIHSIYHTVSGRHTHASRPQAGLGRDVWCVLPAGLQSGGDNNDGVNSL